MATPLKIDFVSDVSCPWCVIGLRALEQAAERLAGEVQLDLHFQPFELNPQMGPEGQDIGEHLQQKYGASAEQREAMGADVDQWVRNLGAVQQAHDTVQAERQWHLNLAQSAQDLQTTEAAQTAAVAAVHAAAPDLQRLADSEPAPAPAPDAVEQVAAMVNSIDAEQVMVRSPVAAQAYMTQVLLALNSAPATTLVETHGNVRHEVDILLYLAQGLGQTYDVAGEDVTLRVAMRVGRLLPPGDLPMLLDCVLDYVPASFSVLLYEFVLAGRDTAST